MVFARIQLAVSLSFWHFSTHYRKAKAKAKAKAKRERGASGGWGVRGRAGQGS